MKQESKFYVNRTIKTISAARLIAADWVWDEITPDAMQTQLTAVTGNNTVSPPDHRAGGNCQPGRLRAGRQARCLGRAA